MFRPSEGQDSQGSVGYAYSEWGEVDENGNVSFGAEYSPRAEANQKQIDEVVEMKRQAREKIDSEIAEMKRQAQEKMDSDESRTYRADDDKAKATRARIAELQKQLEEDNTAEAHAEVRKEIEFFKSVLESNGYEPYS